MNMENLIKQREVVSKINFLKSLLKVAQEEKNGHYVVEYKKEIANEIKKLKRLEEQAKILYHNL